MVLWFWISVSGFSAWAGGVGVTAVYVRGMWMGRLLCGFAGLWFWFKLLCLGGDFVFKWVLGLNCCVCVLAFWVIVI